MGRWWSLPRSPRSVRGRWRSPPPEVSSIGLRIDEEGQTFAQTNIFRLEVVPAEPMELHYQEKR